MCGRLLTTLPKPSREIECPYEPATPLNGIVSYLARKAGRNVHDAGVVTVTTSSVQTANTGKNAADVETGRFFCSKDLPGQWICYDFHEMRVRPTEVALRSYLGPGGYNLKSWVIEGSNDGEKWDQIGKGMQLHPGNEVCRCGCVSGGEWRFLRLRQTDRNENGNHILCLTAFECFGSLIR
jgi:hypothetical protein